MKRKGSEQEGKWTRSDVNKKGSEQEGKWTRREKKGKWSEQEVKRKGSEQEVNKKGSLPIALFDRNSLDICILSNTAALIILPAKGLYNQVNKITNNNKWMK